MKKSVIGLLFSLFSLYVLWLKLNPGTESHTAASVSPALLSTAQMDSAQNSNAGAPDLSKLPPKMREAIQKEAEARVREASSGKGVEYTSSDSSGFDPGGVVGNYQPLEKPAAAPPRASIDDGSAKQFNYRDRNEITTTTFASGWMVVVERKLSDRRTTLADRVLTQLERQLDRSAGALPRTALTELRKVPIWVRLTVPDAPLIRYRASLSVS